MENSQSSLVSIIIPCYKAEKELPEALDSISGQSYTHWEVILVNDGWPDNTEEIVNQFRKRHPNRSIKYIKHPANLGLGATRNTGIAAATGEFVAFLDHDDIWEGNHLSTAIHLLENNKADIYYSSIQVFDYNGYKNHCVWGPTKEDLETFPQSIFGRNFIQPSAVVISSKFLTTLGTMETNPKIHFCEDHDFWIRAVNLEGKFITSPTITARYRSANPEAATSKIALMLKHDIAVQKKHFNSNKFTTDTKRRAIGNNYRRLADHFWKFHHLKSLYYLFMSLYWHPTNRKNIEQFLKGLVYWPSVFGKYRKA